MDEEEQIESSKWGEIPKRLDFLGHVIVTLLIDAVFLLIWLAIHYGFAFVISKGHEHIQTKLIHDGPFAFSITVFTWIFTTAIIILDVVILIAVLSCVAGDLGRIGKKIIRLFKKDINQGGQQRSFAVAAVQTNVTSVPDAEMPRDGE